MRIPTSVVLIGGRSRQETTPITMSTTKHVKFSEDTDFTPSAPEPRPNGFAVHPDRLAAVTAASSQAQAVKKTKTKVRAYPNRLGASALTFFLTIDKNGGST